MTTPETTSPLLSEEFNLVKFAEQVKSENPSYEELIRDSAPKFRKFLDKARERLVKVRLEHGDKKTITIVLGTGGTFQSAETDHGLAPSGSLQESFDALGLPKDPSMHIDLCDLMCLDSSQMTVEHWRFLAEMIIELEYKLSDVYDSIIITHGTDTMSKGAAYLSFMLRGFPKSIIFTGSQQPARKSDSDAKDQMERALATARISSNANRRITEVMVACGLQVARGTWAAKLGDKTSNAFGPWNQQTEGHDATDWERAALEGYLDRLAPALLDFGNGKTRGSLEFAGHAIDYEHRGPFMPFTEITAPADVFPAELSDKSRGAFARHIISQTVSVLTQLGSATADDPLVAIALEAARRGKIIVFEAPFADSSIEAGTYAAGAKVRVSLPNILRPLPIINTSPSGFQAKINYLLHRLGITSIYNSAGLGLVFADEDLRRFYDHMEQNLVRELV